MKLCSFPFLMTKMNIIKNNETYLFLFYFLLFIDHLNYDLSLYLSSKTNRTKVNEIQK